MQIGMVGLGKMGGNMSRRLVHGGHEVVTFDLDAVKVAEFEKEGMKGATDLPAFVALLQKPRVVWLMVPAGDATESMVNKFAALFEPGDIMIDGGNSYYKDDVRRAVALRRERHSVRRCRHQRRRLGNRARLLPDGGRRAGDVQASRADLQNPRAGHGRCSGYRRPQNRRPHRAPRLSALRTQRRRATSSRWCTTESSTA